jgi:AcrR family transcriptional regulator
MFQATTGEGKFKRIQVMATKTSVTDSRKRRRTRTDAARSPLTKQTILQAALKLAGDKGFDALSMRRLGRELHIEAMSIYHYFKNKDDLLDGLHSLMMQHIFKIMQSDLSQDPSWEARARSFAAAYRIVGRKHPHVFRIVAQRPLIMDEAIPTGRTLMDALRESGFTDNDAIVAYRSITCFVAGFVLLENAALKPLYTTGDFDLEYTRGLEVVVTGIRERLPTKTGTSAKITTPQPVRPKKTSPARRHANP